ncbi:MAG TPA: hypothetical protein VKK81_20115, partial [Candidatus Binatia bacterium]|nr:hypothetical protein [Candidatus Binatia bacterium]
HRRRLGFSHEPFQSSPEQFQYVLVSFRLMIMENRFDHFIDSLFLARPPTPSHPPSAQTTRKTQPPYPILSWLSPNRRAGRYEAPSVGVGAGKLLSDDQATTKPVGQLFSLPHTTTG